MKKRGLFLGKRMLPTKFVKQKKGKMQRGIKFKK